MPLMMAKYMKYINILLIYDNHILLKIRFCFCERFIPQMVSRTARTALNTSQESVTCLPHEWQRSKWLCCLPMLSQAQLAGNLIGSRVAGTEADISKLLHCYTSLKCNSFFVVSPSLQWGMYISTLPLCFEFIEDTNCVSVFLFSILHTMDLSDILGPQNIFPFGQIYQVWMLFFP